MKRIRTLFICSLLLMACAIAAQAQSVQTDYDRSYSLARLKTYGFYQQEREPGDSMILWVDVMTRRLRRVEVQTTLERKPVRVVSDFQDLPAGPTFTARSTVDYPSKELTLITENFDYERVTR